MDNLQPLYEYPLLICTNRQTGTNIDPRRLKSLPEKKGTHFFNSHISSTNPKMSYLFPHHLPFMHATIFIHLFLLPFVRRLKASRSLCPDPNGASFFHQCAFSSTFSYTFPSLTLFIIIPFLCPKHQPPPLS